ncbi:Uncharacterised protein [uncultured archaeon]|nr:Uncharacterised protein [uncultured archaeon]
MASAEKKDPGIAALIAAAGMLILGAPSLGYFYLGNVRKGIVYLIASWVLVGLLAVIYFAGGILTGIGFVCLLPIFLVALLFEFAIVWDVYKTASGEKPVLPQI